MDILAAFLESIGVLSGDVVIVEDKDLGVDSLLGLVDGTIERGEEFTAVDKVVDLSRQRSWKSH